MQSTPTIPVSELATSLMCPCDARTAVVLTERSIDTPLRGCETASRGTHPFKLQRAHGGKQSAVRACVTLRMPDPELTTGRMDPLKDGKGGVLTVTRGGTPPWL